MTGRGIIWLKLTAANRNDNFQFVAIVQHLSIELPAWHNLAIALQRDAFID